MTKTFEEELKDREAETFSYWDGCTISKKEFINYADVVNLSQGWVSPEEYEKLVKNCAVYVLECKNINRVNAQLTKENENLKSQLQQQALPVVKDFVAEWYQEHEDDLDFSIFEACVNLHDDNSSDFEKWFGNSENKSIETLVRMKDGYTVEKPQLFYLRDELTGQFLAKDNQFKNEDRYFFWTGADPLTHSIGTAWKLTFTQQEIDSMQTGSYEQIEVEK